MVRLGACLLVLMLALNSTGCKTSAALAAERARIAGKWYAKPASSSYDPGGGLASLFGNASGTIVLELRNDGKFEIDLFGLPMEGSYELGGDKITMKPEKLVGIEPMFGGELTQKLKGKFLFGGKTIFVAGRSGWQGYSDLKFTREPPPEERIGPRSVNAAEASLVGDYVFDDSVKPNTPEVPGLLGGKESMDGLFSSTSLSLREDNTFEMRLIFKMKGTWRLNGSWLSLSLQGGAFGSQNLQAQVSKFGKQILMMDDYGSQVEYALKRKSQ